MWTKTDHIMLFVPPPPVLFCSSTTSLPRAILLFSPLCPAPFPVFVGPSDSSSFILTHPSLYIFSALCLYLVFLICPVRLSASSCHPLCLYWASSSTLSVISCSVPPVAHSVLCLSICLSSLFLLSLSLSVCLFVCVCVCLSVSLSLSLSLYLSLPPSVNPVM